LGSVRRFRVISAKKRSTHDGLLQFVDALEDAAADALFVEEMTKAVLEAEGDGAAERTVAAVPSPALAVPATLHASLMARLDRLGPAKEVARSVQPSDASSRMPWWTR
jgi:hypothetical protein